MNCPFLVTQLSFERGIQSDSLIDFIKFELDLQREGVVATWYSSMLLFLAGSLAWMISKIEISIYRFPRLIKFGWLAAGVFFFAISADEIGQIHENIPSYLKSKGLDVSLGPGAWVPMLLPLIAALIVGMIFFFSVMLAREKKPLILALAAIACWVLALLAEWSETNSLGISMSKDVEGFIEESLEITGTTLFCCSFVSFLQTRQRAQQSIQGEGKHETTDSRVVVAGSAATGRKRK